MVFDEIHYMRDPGEGGEGKKEGKGEEEREMKGGKNEGGGKERREERRGR